MEPFETIDIQELPLSVPAIRRQVEDFLGSNGLRLGEVDLYLAVLSGEGAILAGGGLQRDILKCLAVSAEARSLGLSVPLISRLISVASERGFTNLKVFTKPENRALFESLGFKLLAEAPKAILMENGRGLEEYCNDLRDHQAPGVIVMNANPFTLGHQYLVEQASPVVVIPVKEDVSRFPYVERLAMIRAGVGEWADVVEGSDYQISAATFPTYFLKDLSDAAETQMRLDIDLFGRHIAPALGARVRFVGSEPADPLTARYNALMKELLPAYGVDVVEIPRLTDAEGPVTATHVRALLDEGRFKAASALTPASTWPYLLADLAERAMRLELDTPLKPGLVGPDSVGAHKDMDYDVMRKGIAAIRPFFPRMAMAETPEELRQLGIDAEAAMLAATGGVNTHRGAIFALGLALYRHPIAETAVLLDNGTSKRREAGVRGAMQMAKDGYKELFEDWLPYYASVKSDAYGLQKTLLRIMATLDDTCIIHRVGYERALEVKKEVKALLSSFTKNKLEKMCEEFAAEGISPGGAADMLALTILIESLLN
ncbi:MAG: triphosphoribosyl-dephospho-CoA synthase [Bacteroidales bacterium]|nr:triphosphoribosyl-dephospho-CoA synthase [Bacteroidales bacterium]